MKTYWLRFGSANPATNTGLSPTFIRFFDQSGNTLTPPGITEIFTGSGLYRFQYTPSATLSVIFTADGGSLLASTDRYIVGTLDPVQAVDQVIGTTSDSFGSTSADPTTVLGYNKRLQEFLEGNKQFVKSTGVWNNYSRGSSTLLRVKTLTNSLSEADST